MEWSGATWLVWFGADRPGKAGKTGPDVVGLGGLVRPGAGWRDEVMRGLAGVGGHVTARLESGRQAGRDLVR